MTQAPSHTEHPSPTPIGNGTDAPSSNSMTIIHELLKELTAQRAALQQEHRLAAAERKAERRWKMLFQGLLFGGPLILGILYFLFFLNSTGFRWGPWSDVVGVVHIDGQISPGELASADKIIPALGQAFSTAAVKSVVLSIDSPGGATVEAERIYQAVEALKKKHPKPVIAVINNLGASAAYMIAMHTDRVIAARFSLVGSIGTMIEGWDAHRAMDRLDLAQRVYASGPLKSMLSPFLQMSKEADEKAQQLVRVAGELFVNDLKQARGKHLKPGIDYGTGEVWSGQEAVSLGLVDEIGTLDEVIATSWGLKPYDFGPRKEGLGIFSSTLHNGVSAFLENWVAEHTLRLR